MIGVMLKSVKSHTTSLTNAFSVIMVLAVELLMGSNLFKCPCSLSDYNALSNPFDTGLIKPSERVYYAAAFIVWPAMASFIMALAISGNTLRCLTSHRRHCSISRHCRECRFLLSNSVTAFVPPLAWLIVVFMDGRYYECAVSKLPSNCMPAAETQVNNSANYNQLIMENGHHRSTSQIISLTFFGAGICVAALFVLCGQLCSNLTYYQRRYMHSFREKEMETFAVISEEMITAELKEKWRHFFSEARAKDWGEISGLPGAGPTEVSGKEYYTDFHIWQPDTSQGSAKGLPAASGVTGGGVPLPPNDPMKQASRRDTIRGWKPLQHHLVELPVSPESSGALYQGKLATLFVPVQDGHAKAKENKCSLDTTDAATQTKDKRGKNREDSKKVIVNVNEGFDANEDQVGNLVRGVPDDVPLVQNLTLKPHLPMPSVEVYDIYGRSAYR